MTQYQHVAITLRSRQLLKMGTWLPETCWAICKGETNDNTKVTSSWFLCNIWKTAKVQVHKPKLYRSITRAVYYNPALFWDVSYGKYEVCSNSIRIGIVVVVHWVGCVGNQSWHVRACLSNSLHKLQVAAFAQLAEVDRRSNTCVYVIAIFTMCETTEQRICITFCIKIGKTAKETYQLLQ